MRGSEKGFEVMQGSWQLVAATFILLSFSTLQKPDLVLWLRQNSHYVAQDASVSWFIAEGCSCSICGCVAYCRRGA